MNCVRSKCALHWSQPGRRNRVALPCLRCSAGSEFRNVTKKAKTDLHDTLVLLGEQAKSALDIYDKEIMVTTLKAVIAAAERVKP